MPHTSLSAAGNLVGTLFQKQAAQRILAEAREAERNDGAAKSSAESTKPRELAVKAREASRALQNLTSKQREQLLHKIADNLLAKEDEIMAENERDIQVGASWGFGPSWDLEIQ